MRRVVQVRVDTKMLIKVRGMGSRTRLTVLMLTRSCGMMCTLSCCGDKVGPA